MNPVLTPAAPAPIRRRSGVLVVLIGVVVAVAAVAVLVPATKTPEHVSSITIANPHGWPAGVQVAGANRQGWVGIGVIDGAATRTFEEILDQGRVWVFRFSYAGVDGGELVVSRADLERGAWKVSVPDEFEARIRAAGVVPPTG